MTDKPTCDVCGKPIPDTAYVCTRCAEVLKDALELVAKLAGEAMTTIAKQDRIGDGGTSEPDSDPWDKNPNALYPTPLPYDPGAARAHDAAVNTVVTWARHVSEERGIALPNVHVACRHYSCARIRRVLSDGPLCPDGAETEQPFAVAAAWLAVHLGWLRHRQEAAEAFGELTQACKALERVIDRHPPRKVVGQCPCGEFLYAIGNRGDVRCKGCGTTYDVEATRDQLRKHLGESLMTAAEIATMAAYLGIGGSREAVRKRINQWSTRGRLAVHDYQGQPAYRFGEVIARLAEAVS